MAYLALVRHGESEWNALEKWTGWTDIGLSPKGHQQAKTIGEKIKETKWNYLFESDLLRVRQTSDEIVSVLKYTPERIVNEKLREKDYGIYTGKNKLQVEKEVGETSYIAIRKSWDFQIPEGESLKDVYNRVIPYFQNEILPKLKEGKNVIICFHHHPLRALVKYLDNISDEGIINFEIPVGEVLIREF